jgi:osmotically-inducible protein OsmY/predicted Ser/Thr protein kinase
MKRCPSCRRVYDRDSEVCQADGTTLADFNMDPVVGQTIAKRYQVVRRLGGGSLGTVYLAKELATGHDIALKILVKEVQCDDEALKQCRWDARFATASQPSKIVRVFEVDRTDEGQVFIAMEYLEGENLADMIRREGALELGRALRLASQIAQGLVAASRAGVPHRDLKPQNVVVVGPDERVKVTDFGVARLWRTTMGGTRTRLDSATLEYTAPERLIGGDADDRTDVYGLGAMLYAMLTGAAPPTGASRGTEGSETLWQAPPPVRELRPEVPVALEQALLRAMEREPERRQSGMHEFAEGLLDLAATVIERKTRQAATLAVRESALEPSAPAPPRSDTRSDASQEQWRERRQAYREHWQARRGRWQAQWQAYRVQFQAYREQRQAERLAYRAQLEAQRQSGREQRQADRLAYHAQLEAQRQAAREQRQARRLRWQTQWRAYRVQFQSYRERQQAQRLAYRAQLEAQRQVSREQRQVSREQRQVSREQRQMQLQALRERWQSRLERARSSLGESTGRLTALASRSLGDSLRWGHANGGRLTLGGMVALVMVGAMAWAALDRRAEAPAPVQSTAGRDSGSVDEPGAVGVPSQIVAAAPPRRAESESSGVVDLAPSPPTPAGEGPKHPGRIQAERPREAASQRPIAPAAEVKPAPHQPSPRPSVRPEVEVDASPPTPAGEDPEHPGRIQAERPQEAASQRPIAPAAEVEPGPHQPSPRPSVRPEVEVDASSRGSAEPASRPVSLSAQQISRIQTEAEHTLQRRGLLRVSAADRWGVTLETAPTGEVTLSGVLRDMVLYADAIRLVREVPGVREVRGSVQVADAGTVSVAQSESARLRIEIQQRLRSGGLLRESASDRWGVLVEVSPEGEVTLVGAVRDAEMYREVIRRAQEVSKMRLVKQNIRVMDRGNGQ